MNMTNIRKSVIIASGLVLIIVLIATALIYIKMRDLSQQIFQSKSALSKARLDVASLEEQKARALRESEKLQADSLSYLNINTKLQNEKDSLQKAVEDAEKVIEGKESGLRKANNRLNEIEKMLAKAKSKERKELTKEKKVLAKKVLALNSTLKKERTVYHYNLGVAYASAKLYDDAIVEYRKSLETDPDNADTHYNLALLYDMVQSDPENALIHYEKYLKLNPNAEDKEEVEALISKYRK